MSDISVKVLGNGPYILEGPMVLTDPNGTEVSVPEGETVALCRCGLSTEKPFCTGTHRGQFEASEAITRTFGA